MHHVSTRRSFPTLRVLGLWWNWEGNFAGWTTWYALLTIDTCGLKDLKNEKWIKECCIIMKGLSKDFFKFTVPLDYLNWEIMMDGNQRMF